MGVRRFPRHSGRVINSRRWKALRLEALRRDGWACVRCGEPGRLEVDHIRPVSTHPEQSFELANLQTLCARCHAAKTRNEVGLPPIPVERQRWRDLMRLAPRMERG